MIYLNIYEKKYAFVEFAYFVELVTLCSHFSVLKSTLLLISDQSNTLSISPIKAFEIFKLGFEEFMFKVFLKYSHYLLILTVENSLD